MTDQSPSPSSSELERIATTWSHFQAPAASQQACFAAAQPIHDVVAALISTERNQLPPGIEQSRALGQFLGDAVGRLTRLSYIIGLDFSQTADLRTANQDSIAKYLDQVSALIQEAASPAMSLSAAIVSDATGAKVISPQEAPDYLTRLATHIANAGSACFQVGVEDAASAPASPQTSTRERIASLRNKWAGYTALENTHVEILSSRWHLQDAILEFVDLVSLIAPDGRHEPATYALYLKLQEDLPRLVERSLQDAFILGLEVASSAGSSFASPISTMMTICSPLAQILVSLTAAFRIPESPVAGKAAGTATELAHLAFLTAAKCYIAGFQTVQART